MSTWWAAALHSGSNSTWDSLPSGVAAEVIGAAIVALFVGLWRPVTRWLTKRRHPDRTGVAAFTDEVRVALLNRVRERSTGQLDGLIGLPAGYADLDLEPIVDLVKGWKAGVPVTVEGGGDIFEMFNRAEGRLLITGEPGSGKTILLYKLAEYLDSEARSDLSAPLPLVVNLSGWAVGTTFRDWLIGFLCDPTWGYGLRDTGLAANLVASHRFALLLDGLDEVSGTERDRCLTAINDYVGSLPAPPFAPLVITCRIADYEALIDDQAPTSRLRLIAAGHVQPLAEATVTSNLRHIAAADPSHEPGWTALRKAISGGLHQHLFIVLANPLLLSLATQSRLDPESLLAQPDRHTATTYILDRFYQHALTTGTSIYSDNDTRRWLGWLATFTLTNPRDDTNAFYLEDLTSGPTPQGLNLARALAVGLLSGLFFGLVLGLFFGSLGGLLAWLVLEEGVDSRPTRRMFRRPTWQQLKFGLLVGLLVGLFSGLVLGLSVGLSFGLDVGLSFGLDLGLRVGLAGLIFALAGGRIVGLASALEVDFAISEPAVPDGGLAASRRSWVAETVKWTLLGGLAAGLAGVLAVGLAVGLAGGLLAGLDDGGGYVVRQLVERRELRRRGVLPGDPVEFYDWAVDRGLLRRVGGGWQFRHLLLRDLVADQYRTGNWGCSAAADGPLDGRSSRWR